MFQRKRINFGVQRNKTNGMEQDRIFSSPSSYGQSTGSNSVELFHSNQKNCTFLSNFRSSNMHANSSPFSEKRYLRESGVMNFHQINSCLQAASNGENCPTTCIFPDLNFMNKIQQEERELRIIIKVRPDKDFRVFGCSIREKLILQKFIISLLANLIVYDANHVLSRFQVSQISRRTAQFIHQHCNQVAGDSSIVILMRSYGAHEG